MTDQPHPPSQPQPRGTGPSDETGAGTGSGAGAGAALPRPDIPVYQPPSAVSHPATDPAADPALRAEAAKQLQDRKDFLRHLVVYWIVMTFLVLIWLVTGGWNTYFWPIWPMLGWGLGLALHGFSLGWDRPPTDEQIEAEARRLAARRGQLPPGTPQD